MRKSKLEPPVTSKLLCEFTGSMFLVIAAISPIILFNMIFASDIAIAILADAIAVGLILFLLVEIFRPISGAHFNPAITFALLFRGTIKTDLAVKYILTQIAGGLFGMLGAHLMFFHEIHVFIDVSDITRHGGDYFAEFLGTFILVTAVLFLIQNKSKLFSLAIGMLVGGMLLATSSTMFANPQVSIARVFTYSMAGVRPIDAVFFILAEIIGCIVAVIFFEKAFGYKINMERM